jgi:hypothetical protein
MVNSIAPHVAGPSRSRPAPGHPTIHIGLPQVDDGELLAKGELNHRLLAAISEEGQNTATQ